MIVQVLVNGVIGGSILALTALGLTMIFSILRIPNLAHGTIYMWGAFVGYYLVTLFRIDFFASIVLTAGIIAILGIGIEKSIFKPMRGASPDSVFLLSIGLLILMENLALLMWGEQARRIPAPLADTILVIPGLLYLPALRFMMAISAAVVIIALYILVKRTRMGKAMRAVQQDPVTARLMGIRIDKVASTTFAMGSALAAVAGVFVGATFSLDFGMGGMTSVKSFIVIILGGLGSVPGTIVGGLFLGIVESLVVSYITSEFKNLAAFGILIVILILRPQGLFGREKTR